MPPSVASVPMLDGNSIPPIGLGVWQMTNDQAQASVAYAIETGYRSIDTASIYENEAGVGAALAEVDVARSDLFVTTKVWNDDQGFDTTLRACESSLERMGLDYIDLYLIHWAAAREGKFVDTFKAMKRLRDEGRVRSIGVSNFTASHLTQVMDETGEVPAVNQIELHPRLSQAELRTFHKRYGILTEAYSPLGQGSILGNPVIVDIALELACTPAQAVLAWHLELGNVIIPKSVSAQRIAENLTSTEVTLSAAQLDRIAALNDNHRIGADPDVMW